MTQSRMHAQQLAAGAVGQRPRMEFADAAPLRPGLIEGVEGAGEVSVVIVQKADVRQQRQAPAGMRMAGDEILQRVEVLGRRLRAIGGNRPFEVAILVGRGGRRGDQRLFETDRQLRKPDGFVLRCQYRRGAARRTYDH